MQLRDYSTNEYTSRDLLEGSGTKEHTRLDLEVAKNTAVSQEIARLVAVSGRHELRSHEPSHTLRALQLPSRTLLQADPQCSITDLLAVQADPLAAVTAMLTTNVACAMCLAPCASAADALSCAMGCLEQDEGACTTEEIAAIETVGMPSSLTDRAQMVRMLEVTTRACVRCIVETIASTCGGDCVPERLHVVVDYTYSPRVCLPELAARLSAGEASAFAQAVAASEQFGLTAHLRAKDAGTATGILSDLFIPRPLSLEQPKLYKGVDTGMLAYECDPAVHGRVWVVLSGAANSANDPSWTDCAGPVRIDVDSGEAHSQPASADGSRVPIRFGLNWADCSAFLPFDSLEPSATGKTLGGPVPTKGGCVLAQSVLRTASNLARTSELYRRPIDGRCGTSDRPCCPHRLHVADHVVCKHYDCGRTALDPSGGGRAARDRGAHDCRLGAIVGAGRSRLGCSTPFQIWPRAFE